MVNYSYKDLYMWDDETWRNTDALIHPLVKELLKKSYVKDLNASKTGIFNDRKDAVPDPKTKACVFDDVVEKWKGKGLGFHCTAMGFVSWEAMVPINHDRDTETLVVFTCADIRDKMWAMDLTEYYKKYNEIAARHNFAILYLAQDNDHASGIYTDIMLELSAIFRIDMKKVYLDVSSLENPLDVCDLNKDEFENPVDYHGIKALDITDKWQATTAHQYICMSLNRRNPEYDAERFIHSPLGKRIAESMHMEKMYRKWNDAGLVKEIEDRGLGIEEHYTEDERWLSVVPKNIDKNVPLLICMKEVRPACEFQAVTALQFYYDYLDVAANGECALLFFALESPDDNELLVKILEEAYRIYPIDRSRTYIIGQSHNGCFALEFARRHKDIIAATATLNDRHGFASPRYSVDNVKITDEMVEDFSKSDFPLINICGEIENVFPHTVKGSENYYNQIDAMHRRYKAFNIKDRTDAEIEEALESDDIVTRKNGIPSDRTEVLYTMGFNAYVSDFYNKNGDCHLRLVTLENLPHMITPQMVQLSWSFLRRFKKDENGNTAEIK